MKKDFVSRATAIYVMLLCSVFTALAQQPATGFPTLGSFSSGTSDTVDLANLNVHLSIPIFGRAGRGIPFSYAMSYDSLVWKPAYVVGVLSWQPVPNWGWRTASEAATGWVEYTDYDPENCYRSYSGFVYHDPSGGIHSFGSATVTVHVNGTGCGSGGVTNITYAQAIDNSGYRLSTGWVPPATITATITTAGGVKIVTPNVGTSLGSGSVTDTNGNTITTTYNSTTHVTTIYDTLSATTPALTITGNPPTNAPTCTDSVTGNSYITYSYTAPNTQPANVKVYYADNKVQTYFLVSSPSIAEFPLTHECLVSQVVLPDGGSYQFSYESTNFGSGSSPETTARIASLTLPTGGVISYVYHGGCSNSYNCMLSDGAPAAMQRGFGSSGTWSYTRGAQSG